MSKFAKLFELNGEQLLIKLQPSEEHDELADVVQSYEMEGNVVNITLGGISWESAKRFLENYNQEKANEILTDPNGWTMGMMK